jgi:hypothetical protein
MFKRRGDAAAPLSVASETHVTTNEGKQKGPFFPEWSGGVAAVEYVHEGNPVPTRN